MRDEAMDMPENVKQAIRRNLAIYALDIDRVTVEEWLDNLDSQPEQPKPDWECGPDDATHWAIDASGGAYFHIGEPLIWPQTAIWRSDSVMVFDRNIELHAGKDWRETLTERPQEEQPCNQ